MSVPSSLCRGTEENFRAVVGGLFKMAMLSLELGGAEKLGLFFFFFFFESVYSQYEHTVYTTKAHRVAMR